MLEYVRNVLGFGDADHEESNPEAPRLALTALACSLVGLEQAVTIRPGSLAARLYGRAETVEPFFCNYGVDPEYAALLEPGGLSVTGRDADGGVRIVEVPGHPFFLATLFVPQARSTRDDPHPVVAGLVAAAAGVVSGG